MQRLVLALFFLFVGGLHFPSLAEADKDFLTGSDIESLGFASITNTVNQARGRTNRYCTGFHCYAYSQDFCARVPKENCRMLMIGDFVNQKNQDKAGEPEHYGAGHAQNVLRTRVQKNGASIDYFCIYEPQGGAEKLNQNLCWSKPGSDPVNESDWNPSEEYRKRYCQSRPDVCDKKATTEFQVRDPKDPTPLAYKGWWENDAHSNGQLVAVCDQRNRDTRKLPVVEEIPACRTTFARACTKIGHAVACNRQVHNTNTCRILSCGQNGKYDIVDWSTVPLPACSASQMSEYCKNWIPKISNSTVHKRSGDKFMWEYTTHYCRNPRAGNEEVQLNDFKLFACDKSGNPSTDMSHLKSGTGLPDLSPLPLEEDEKPRDFVPSKQPAPVKHKKLK